MRTSSRLTTFTAVAAASITLAACGTGTSSAGSAGSTASSSSSSSTASPTASVDAQHNSADVAFTQEMIVHHKGAVQMAELAATRASSTQVKSLAQRIEAAQGPEITEMTSWLRAWKQPMKGASGSSMSSSMGMMSDDQMSGLKAASGPAFDTMFLKLMTTHHQGAIAMAQSEQKDGSNPQAIALATSIQASQSAQVSEMAQLLTSLGS